MTRDELFRTRWQLIFDRLGIVGNGPDFEKIFVANLAESAIPVEGANDLVRYLASKYDLYVTSNAIHRQQIVRLTAAHMYDYIKEIFTSEVLGFAKPTKEFFDECFRRIPDVKKENVIIIGDSLTADIKGGVDYGIKTCWFNFKGEKYDERPECDYIVDRLCEIKEIL
jgi:2-haloacid dehalogenase